MQGGKLFQHRDLDPVKACREYNCGGCLLDGSSRSWVAPAIGRLMLAANAARTLRHGSTLGAYICASSLMAVLPPRLVIGRADRSVFGIGQPCQVWPLERADGSAVTGAAAVCRYSVLNSVPGTPHCIMKTLCQPVVTLALCCANWPGRREVAVVNRAGFEAERSSACPGLTGTVTAARAARLSTAVEWAA